MQTTLRNATLGDLAALLTEQHARKVDVVAPAAAVHSEGGVLRIEGTEPVLSDEGVTTADGRYVPTVVCDEGIAEKLSIPTAYLRRMRETRPDLYDANVNGWLHGFLTPEGVEPCENDPRYSPADARSFLVRCFRGDNGDGVARAFLSNGYKIMDDLDWLTATLEGVNDAGVHVEIDSCDLSPRRMRVRLVAPEITALAPLLLANYRNPFDGGGSSRPSGAHGAAYAAAGERFGYDGSMPVIFAGLELSNSETGNGAGQIVPRIVTLRCWNGQTYTADALRAVHLGARMDDGVVRWSVDTQEKNLELVKAQARDAVRTFLDVDYVTGKITEIEEKAGLRIANPQTVVETVCKKLVYSEERTQTILGLFIAGGDVTTGGVMQAVTAAAQLEADPDEAAKLEADGVKALDFAVAVAS